MRWLQWMSALLSCGFAAAAFITSSPAPSPNRTLAAHEVRRIFGGQQPPNNQCCSPSGMCVCGRVCLGADKSTCPTSIEEQCSPGNQRGCFSVSPGINCTQSGSYTCRAVWTCKWDSVSGKCVTDTESQDYNVPVTCTPNC